ncbi:MAG: single-stranded DNA-binding protein [Peptoniphilaceae bacterium]|nr:single-stranded DNA-binding protein [Peptoniphilaceae bacterium]MCI6660691.1 single-stranded DNA-binding protein [Peptoniphilaceae bacterium]MDD7433390.1 single-stranded DNA-binding protein [Peptoniphilaceae bacterium]MDY3076156.1 single-stranded DNA-binding protein [Peptoniphilaceae bacterium]MDY3986694.1 single-stranded DNA-binding protein [Peptoniphilaceae bacterium]
MNQVIISGRVVRDPELTYNNASGNAMVRFSVAVDRRLSREKKQEMESRNQPTADFINVVCWGRLAENVNNFTAKGKRVLVEGRIQTGSYQAQDGTRRYTTDVIANNVEFIDWKDRDGGFPSNADAGSRSGAPSGTNSNDSSDQGFFTEDFNPVDDDRIPF